METLYMFSYTIKGTTKPFTKAFFATSQEDANRQWEIWKNSQLIEIF